MVTEAGKEAIKLLDSGSARLRKKLWDRSSLLNEGLKHIGCDTCGSESPIVPVMAGDTKTAMRMSRALKRNGIYAPPIRPPTVPEGKCRIRFSVTAAHSKEDIELVLGVMKKLV